MIIVKLMGGLGNQMFQYAAGRSLACRLGTDLKLDISSLDILHERNTPRTYELDCFNIVAEIASHNDIKPVSGEKTVFSALRTKLRKRLVLQWETPHLYREPHYHYDEFFERLSDNTYLVGYWHSERYFASVTDRIRQDFTCRYPLAGRNLEIAAEIEETNSVSIHVRRGDYVTDKLTNEYHGVCSLEYYKDAIAEIVRRGGTPHFFVFSDDHGWAKEHLLNSHPTTFVDCNGLDKGYEDLRLMSLCNHHIIANSSFSWWGAWLSRHPEKVVIAPRKWFNQGDIDTSDLIPQGWLRL